MEKIEKEFIELKTNFKRYIEEGNEEKRENRRKLDEILEQVKYTNGRVKELEVTRRIEKAVKDSKIKTLEILASLGFLGGAGAFLPEILKFLSI